MLSPLKEVRLPEIEDLPKDDRLRLLDWADGVSMFASDTLTSRTDASASLMRTAFSFIRTNKLRVGCWLRVADVVATGLCGECVLRTPRYGLAGASLAV